MNTCIFFSKKYLNEGFHFRALETGQIIATQTQSKKEKIINVKIKINEREQKE